MSSTRRQHHLEPQRLQWSSGPRLPSPTHGAYNAARVGPDDHCRFSHGWTVLELVPVTQAEAKAFVERHHRHSIPPLGSIGQVGLTQDGEEICGVAIWGRPVARMTQQDPFIAEVLRVCVLPNVKNGCSKLYAACWMAARGMGYRKLITYTLKTEPGSSLKAAGWKIVGEVKKQSWHRPNRPRVDKDERQERFRWEKAA